MKDEIWAKILNSSFIANEKAWIATNTQVPADPLTAETFQKNMETMLESYKKSSIQPDEFAHTTPCCYRVYITLGPCADSCPYDCEGPWKNGYCPSCQAVHDWLKASWNESKPASPQPKPEDDFGDEIVDRGEFT